MIARQGQVWFLFPFVALLLTLSLTIAGCGDTPTPTPMPKPQPTFALEVSPGMKVQVGQRVAIVAKVGPIEKLDLKWSVSGDAKGTLNTDTGEQVIYIGGIEGIDFVTAEGTTASGAPVKQTVTLTVVGEAVATATHMPSPTPVVEITNPVDAIDCPGTGECRFTVEGTLSDVVANRDLRIYVFVFPVDPPGSGWYPQVSPATVKRDGTWSQTPAWLGSKQYPTKSGDTFQIVALVVHKDADWRGTKLSDLSPEAAMPTYQDIDYVAVSDLVSLRVR